MAVSRSSSLVSKSLSLFFFFHDLDGFEEYQSRFLWNVCNLGLSDVYPMFRQIVMFSEEGNHRNEVSFL